MSKNFEKEYIALTEIEVPDLWDRIEAGLTPKSMPKSENGEASIIDFSKESVSVKETESGNKEKQTDDKTKTPIHFFKRYKTVIAAAVCVIVILPAAIVLGKMDIGFGSAKEESAADTAAPESMEYAVVTEAASEDAMAEEAPAEMMEFEEQEEAGEEVFSEAEEYEEAAMAEEMFTESAEKESATGNTEAAMTEAAETENAKKEAAVVTDEAEIPAELADEKAKSQSTTEGLRTEAVKEEAADVVNYLDAPDGTVLTHVRVLVYEREELSKTEETDGLGNLYRAEVLEDADGLLKEGEEILIYISPLSSTYLPDEEAVYDVMLEYDSTREYPFYLKVCY